MSQSGSNSSGLSRVSSSVRGEARATSRNLASGLWPDGTKMNLTKVGGFPRFHSV